jgi:peroxiredoxin
MSAGVATASKGSAPEFDVASAGGTRNRRNAIATLLMLVVTGAVIAAAAYLSNPQLATNAGDPATGDFTTVNVTGGTGAAPVVGQPAPDFLAALADGSQIKLSELQGKPVWLTFGASWCQPCRAENPDIQATHVAFGDNVTVVQVYMDEDAETVSDYTSRVGIDYLAVPDPNERLAAQYRILGIPSHFFIDANGVLRQMKIGSMSPATMKAALDSLSQ